MTKDEYHRMVWLAWAQWNDGTWGVWPALGCGNTRRQLKTSVMQYLIENNVRWALRLRDGVLTYNNRIRLVKHVLPVGEKP